MSFEFCHERLQWKHRLLSSFHIVMYKTIFVINIIIYMCLQHSIVYESKTAVFLSLRERICFPKHFAALSLLLKEFAPLRIFCRFVFT